MHKNDEEASSVRSDAHAMPQQYLNAFCRNLVVWTHEGLIGFKPLYKKGAPREVPQFTKETFTADTKALPQWRAKSVSILVPQSTYLLVRLRY